MARYLRWNRDISIDTAAVAPRTSLTRWALAIISLCTDILFEPGVIVSAAVTFQIARGLLTRASLPWGFAPAVRRMPLSNSGFLIASGAIALALIGAGSWPFDRITRDRRTYDWSERP